MVKNEFLWERLLDLDIVVAVFFKLIFIKYKRLSVLIYCFKVLKINKLIHFFEKTN